MKNNKLDALLWEHNMFDNFIIQGATEIWQENLDEICFKNVDELRVARDDDYKIKLTCVRHIDRFNSPPSKKKSTKGTALAGTPVPEGKIVLRLFDKFEITMTPCYYNGYESKMDKTEYKISCYHIEGKYLSEKAMVLKEWLINGNSRGLRFCANGNFEYTVEGTTFGVHGDMEFPCKQILQEREYYGDFVHVTYKDTAFDVHYVSDSYGPKWSNNISISYYEDYGRIPSVEEREIIREYISFFSGKKLMYTGESQYDKNGNVIGFIMVSPYSYGMDIKNICASSGGAPIRDDYTAAKSYYETITKHLESFEHLYKRLDFKSLFSSYWYAQQIAKPMDLPILSGALERMMKKWYSEMEKNPETVLMDKKEFSKRISPILEIVGKQFEGTRYGERMKNSLINMNRMSVSEQFTYFFNGIGLAIGEAEKEALRARNLSAHGSHRGDENFHNQIILSRVYECIIVRVVLKLLGYEGAYVDYGTLGYPEKDINCPSGK